MTPGDITIAVTVFDRRDYIEQAVASALNATVKMDFAPAGIVWTLSLDTQHFTLRSDRPEPRT